MRGGSVHRQRRPFGEISLRRTTLLLALALTCGSIGPTRTAVPLPARTVELTYGVLHHDALDRTGWIDHFIDLPAGSPELYIELDGLPVPAHGSTALYVRHGGKASPDSWDCRSFSSDFTFPARASTRSITWLGLVFKNADTRDRSSESSFAAR